MDETDDLNRLIRELNAGAPGERASVDADDDSPARDLRPASAALSDPGRGESARLAGWLAALVERQGADLLLVAGAPPSVRVDGRILPLAEAPVAGEEIEDAVLPVLPRHARDAYRRGGIADASHRVRIEDVFTPPR